MKRLILVVAIVALFVMPVMADEIQVEPAKEPINVPSLKLPDMQAGMVYSVKEGKIGACATLTALKYPTKYGDVELRGGFAVNDIKEINAKKPIAALCVKIGDLSSLGIEQPLHNIINLSAGIYAGYDFDIQEADFGIVATILQLKW